MCAGAGGPRHAREGGDASVREMMPMRKMLMREMGVRTGDMSVER